MTQPSHDQGDGAAWAARWVVRLSADDVQESEALAFDAWLRASEGHQAAYDAALEVWLLTGAGAAEILAALPTPRPQPVNPRRWYVMAGGLAAALAAAFIALPMIQSAPTEVYATAKGEHRTVSLADGSTIELNGSSRVTVTLARDKRRVTLADGEALFDVAHDPRRPFHIAAGDRTVAVVGTRFDVRHRDGQLAVTVERGVVEVRPTADTGAGRAFRLHPGQRLEHRQGLADAQISLTDPAEALSWRTGRLVIRNWSLGEVVAELNRQFDRPILLDDPSLATARVSGVLVMDNQNAVISRLGLLLPLKALPSAEGVRLQRANTAQP